MKKFEGYMHGVNLGGWLSQCSHVTEHYEKFISEDDLMKIKSWGLDHVRVPVDYELVEDKDGNVKEGGYKYIDRAIEWCKNAGLNMILDLHRTYGYSFYEGYCEVGFFDDKPAQERFYKLWEQFATRYGNLGDSVSFELLNEVTDKDYCDRWNRIANECIKRIRAIAPTVKILVGGYWNNSVESVTDLLAPYDENIVYNFHCYEPLAFTHQGANWVNNMPDDFRMSYDHTMKEVSEITGTMFPEQTEKFLANADNVSDMFGSRFYEKFFADAIAYAEKQNVALYCGEYGVISNTDPAEILKWYKGISAVFEKYGIGRAAWSYKWMNFGLTDPYIESVRDDVIKLL